jgi:hypothetical protein
VIDDETGTDCGLVPVFPIAQYRGKPIG